MIILITAVGLVVVVVSLVLLQPGAERKIRFRVFGSILGQFVGRLQQVSDLGKTIFFKLFSWTKNFFQFASKNSNICMREKNGVLWNFRNEIFEKFLKWNFRKKKLKNAEGMKFSKLYLTLFWTCFTIIFYIFWFECN